MKRLTKHSAVIVTALLLAGVSSAWAANPDNNRSDSPKASVLLSATNADGRPILKNDITWTVKRTDGVTAKDKTANRHTVWLNLDAGRYTVIAERQGKKHRRDFHVFANTRNKISVPVQ